MRKPRPLIRHLAASTGIAATVLASGPAWGQAALPVPAGIALPSVGPLQLPTGVASPVVAGSADITYSPDLTRLDVDLNTAGSVINWSSFSVGRVGSTPNIVSFNNNTAANAAVLNRVTGPLASQITGRIIADADVSVYLVNQNGITFGSGANVNVGALIASTLNINANSFTDAAGSAPGTALRFASPGSVNGIRIDGGTIDTLKGATAGLGQLVLLGAFVGRPTSAVPSASQAASTQTAGSDLAFVAGTDITMTRAAGSPLAFTITRGTTVANAIHADGTVNGQNVTLAVANAGMFQDAILNVAGTVTASVATGTNRGVVLAAGNVSVPNVDYGTTGTAGGVTAEVSGSLNSRSAGGGVIVQSNSATSVTGSIDASRVRIGGASVALGEGANPVPISATGGVDISAGSGGITADAGAVITANSGNSAGANPLTLQVLSGGNINLAARSALRGGTTRSSDVLIYAPGAGATVQLGKVDARGLYGTDASRTDRDAIVRTGSLTVGDVTVTAPLSLTADGITAGALSSGGALTLASSGTISAASLTAAGALAVSGTGALTVTGATRATGSAGDVLIDRSGIVTLGSLAAGRNLSIGQTTAARRLTVNGAATAVGDFRVTTTGAQLYSGAMTLGPTTVLTSTVSGAIELAGAVDGASALTINTGGITRFSGTVGGTRPLASLTTDETGITDLQGAITTSGAQSFGDAVTLNGNVTLTGTTSSFASTITGNGFDLALNFSGTTAIDPALISGFRNLSTGGGGATTLKGAITTTGTQTYGDAVTLIADTTLNASGSAIAFGTALDSDATARALTVTTSGAVTFGGAVGSINRLASITATSTAGTTVIGGAAVRTDGAQTYRGAVLIGAATTLDADSGAIDFTGTLDSQTATARALTVTTSGATTFARAVGGVSPLASLTVNGGGTIAINGGRVTTTGGQTYANPVTLGASTTLTGTTGNFTTLAGNGYDLALDFSGTTAVNADLSNLRNLSTRNGGITKLQGTITTTGTQTYGDDVVLGGDVVLDAGAAAITFAGTLDSEATPRALTVNSTGTTTFAGVVGGKMAGQLASLKTNAGGTTAINGGAITTTGAQTYGDGVTLGANTVLTGESGSFTTVAGNGFDLALNFTALTAIKDNFAGIRNLSTGNGGTTTLQGLITTTGTQTYGDAVVLAGDSVLDAGEAAVTFAGTLDSDASPRALTVNSRGITRFSGTVGGTVRLGSITTNVGGSTLLGGIINTLGAQTYGDAVLLSAATSLNTSNGPVTFADTVDSQGAVPQSLSIINTGTTTFSRAVGGTNRLASLVTDAGGVTAINGSAITTAGAQTYGDPITLGANTVLTGASGSFRSLAGNGFDLALNFTAVTAINGGFVGVRNLSTGNGGTTTLEGTITTTGTQTYGDAVLLGGDTVLNAGAAAITFANTLDSGATPRALAVNTTGATIFRGAVGGTSGGQLASLVTNPGGTTAIDGGAIRTVGAQTYGDAVTLGANAVLAGTTPRFTTVSGNNFDLALDFSGPTSINGGFTGIRNLSTGGGGTTTLQGAITTTGEQSYADAVLLGSNTVLAGTMARFGSTVVGGGFDLALNVAGTTAINGGFTGIRNLSTSGGGITSLQGAITTTGTQTYGDAVQLGGNTVLTGTEGNFGSTLAGGGFDLALNFSGATTINGGFTGIRNLLTGTAGTTTLRGAIATTGTQTYGNAVLLGGETILSASAISFARTVDGGFGLTANSSGLTSFVGAVGSTQALTALTTDTAGTTAINGGAITTTGAQAYGDALTLGADTVLSGDSLSFARTIDGARALTLNAAGLTRFGGVVGGTQKLTSLTTDSAGTTTLGGGALSTTGAQTFGDAVTLGADTVIQAGGIGFANTIDGGFALNANSGGVTLFGGAVGATEKLAALTTDAAGTTALNAGIVSTTGAQVYNDAVVLGAATALDAGEIAFARTLDGAFALTANSLGTTRFGGIVGGTQAVASLATDVAGATAIDGGAITTTGTQTYADPVTLGASAVLTGSAGSFAGVSGGGHDLQLVFPGGVRVGGSIVEAGGLTIRGEGIDLAGQTVSAVNAALDAGSGALTAGTLDIANGLAGNGGSVAIDGASAGTGSLLLRATSGGLTLGSGRAGTDAGLSATGGDLVVTRLDAGGRVMLDTNRNARLGEVVTSAGDVVVTASAGEIGGIGAGAANIRAPGAITLTGGTLARLGTVGAGAALTARAAAIAAGTATAGGPLTLLAEAGSLTLGTGTAGTSATLSARDAATIGTATAGTSLNARAASITAGTAAATGGLTLAASAGPLTLMSGRAGSTAALSATGGDLAVNQLDAGGDVAITTNRNARIGDLATTAGNATITASGGEISGIGTGSANVRAARTVRLTGGTLARLGTIEAGDAIDATAATIAAMRVAATNGGLTLTATSGPLTLASGRAGTAATLTARDAVSIGAPGEGLSARRIAVSSNDISLGGTIQADGVTLINSGGGPMRLGSAGDSGYALAEAEFRTITTPMLTLDNKASDIAIGDLALADGTGSTNLSLLTTGRIDVTGRLSGNGPGGATPAADAPLRTVRFGGSTSDANAIAATIAVAPTAAAGGRLIFTGNTALDLRAMRVAVGQEAGFLAALGLLPATATPQPTEAVIRNFISTSNSTLYNAGIGGVPYTDTTVVKANTLSVSFAEYGLFQNTAGPGGAPASAGVELDSLRLPTVEASVVGASAGVNGANGFALFGKINNQTGSGAAALGGRTVSLNGVNAGNARLNGCLVNAGGSCLVSVVTTPRLQLFDRSQANILRTADDLALAFDPVIGTNNESLFSDVGTIDLPAEVAIDTPARCDPTSNAACTASGAPVQ